MNFNTSSALPSVTAVISTHDRCADLRETLSKLCALNYPALHIIVADNDSSDDTRRMIRTEFPGVECFPHSFNRPMEGYNLAFERSRSAYVLVLDDDSCPRPGVLDSMVRHLEKHLDIGAAAANIIDLDGSSEWAPYDQVAYSTQWNNLIGCGFLIRRHVLMAAQGYREDFDLYYNDFDLALCILAQNYRIAYHREWIVDHRKSPANRVPQRKTHMMIRNFSWIVRAHFRGAARWNLLLGHALLMLRQAARAGGLAPSMRYLMAGLFSPIDHPIMPVPPSPAANRFKAEFALTSNLHRLLSGRRGLPEIDAEDMEHRESRPAPSAHTFLARKKTDRPPAVCYWEQRMVHLDLMAPRDETGRRARRREDQRIHCDCAARMAWYRSPWPDYQRWLMKCSYLSCTQRRQMARQADAWHYQPLISIITPLHHVLTDQFLEMLLSVEQQIYPHWQFCVVDDGSKRPDLRQAVQAFAERCPGKVKFVFRDENKGICATEQEALGLADGEFAALLDHDDRLAPEALFEVVKRLNEKPDTDWLYSDLDKISPEGERLLHFFKPDWSPDLLTCCNYVLHLSVIRRSLLKEIGGFTMDCDGAQDYDLYLRLAEKTDRVEHIAKVLYSFRQSASSTAGDLSAKPEIYERGRAALQRSLERRGLAGTVEHNTLAWAGHYKIHREPPRAALAELLVGPENTASTVVPDGIHLQTVRCSEAETGSRLRTLIETSAADYLLIRDASVIIGPDALVDLIGQLDVPGLDVISPKIIRQEKVDHSGLGIGAGGTFFFPMRGMPAAEAAYGAAGAVARNVSLASPLLAVVRMNALRKITVDSELGTGAVLDMFLALRENGGRAAVDGRLSARRDGEEPYTLPPAMQIGGHDYSILLRRRPTLMTCGDPFYNRNLRTDPPDFGGRDIL